MVAQQEYAHELNQLFKSINAWINFSQASFDYQLVLANIWVKAFTEVIQELISEQVKGEEFLQVWSSVFDREFAQKLRSEDAVLVQGKFLNTAINYWPHQQQLSKEFFQLLEISSQINLINLLNYLYKEKIQVGVTPKEEIYREDKVVLYRYKSAVPSSLNIPVLIVYALVNRPDIVDLQAGRSLVANLLKLGLDVYLIDWGYPNENERWLTIDKYIDGYINNCVDVIRDRHNLEQINLLGICQGGTFSLCYSSLYPEKVKNLITMVTPVDFHINEGLLNVWSGSTVGSQALDVDLMVDTLGNIPGDFLNFVFVMLKPFQLGVKKYIDLLDILESEDKLLNFLRMEKWIFDSPDQAGEAFREFIKDFYQGNKLIKGQIEIGNKRVDLGNIRIPILNIYAEQDHLVLPASSLALENYVGSVDYTVRSFPVGHIGMYVSSKVQKDLPPTIVDWLKARA
ncbi:class III poly(R)-hydroxyalkanoic acid synthase subunit PhaC [Nostoc sp. T09]|uniref:class III poly(R)-hydroxyalkanoic acid synthase subunit PhaC n=1 Tax=Nostoc sp. T09 TaxID=1932621 RepID=UPI000A3CC45D|nr:class III poly(R)-hydroxyalkanoic acid synthase subunit PhaC [Nostoc sp. T09]OUL36120.1 class III poly(R)-hydroxyalkanoic acid synthase subunit PhaC [Nostoc sp. T09]